MKILVIAPHGDDVVLGVGGALAKHQRNGDTVYRCIVTKPYAPDWPRVFIAKREKEVVASAKVLNVAKDFLLGLPTVKLDTMSQKELNDRLSAVVKEVRPDIVYVPHAGDLNADHRIVFTAALVATRPVPGCSVKKVLTYETISETEWGRNLHDFVPNYYVTLHQHDVDIKLKAMKAYHSEIRKYPHPRSLEILKTLLKLRGSEVGVKAAEAFMVVREIHFD